MIATLIAGLRIYGLANFCLPVSWGLFALASARTWGWSRRVRQQHWLRLGQTLLLLTLATSLLAGLLGHWPQSAVARTHWRALGPLTLADQDSGSNPVAAWTTLGRQAAASASRAIRFSSPRFGFPLVAAIFLLVGYGLGLGRLAWHLRSLQGLIGRSVPIKRFGNLSVRVSEETLIPFSTRLFSGAYVILPELVLANRKDLTSAVHHEIQHHRNGDTRWIWLIEILKIFFFWNPAIYLWARQMAQLQELACDEAVVTHKPLDSHDYGYCLLRVAQATLDRPRAYLGTAGMSSTRLLGKSFLMRRIEMLNRYSKDRTRGGWLAIVSGALGLAGGALFADSPISAKQLPAVNPIVQNIADRVLHQSVTNARADAGFVIVSDVHSGQVLAVAYQGKTEAAANAIPRYLSQPMEPWSLIKPLIAAMAVDAGKTGVEDYHDCENGKLAVGNKVYTDDKPYTRLTTAEMIINSSNVCAIKVAETLGGSQALAQALTRLGFGSGSVVDGFPGAGPGTLASVDEQSDAQFVANAMFGFALRVTPLEMVQAYGAIANGGSLLQPQEYGAAHSPTVVRQPFSAGTAAQLRDVLARVVTEGTGKRAALARYTTAGKTGTGSWERVVDGRDHTADKTVVASFTGFAPAKDPQIVVYVSIENPRRGQLDGGTQAAPVFATIADQTLTALQIPSDRK